MVHNSIQKLELSDIALEGVDFHCSAILNVLVSDPAIVNKSIQRLLCIVRDTRGSNDGPRPSPKQFRKNSEFDSRPIIEHRKEALRDTFKECIWNFRAGVNHRLVLKAKVATNDVAPSGQPQSEQQEQEALPPKQQEHQEVVKELWHHVLEPKVQSYARGYVTSRLSK